jgi:hypothetical protein
MQSIAVYLLALAVAVVAAVGLHAAQHIKNATLRDTVDMACKTAGGLAYYFLLSMTGGTTPLTALSRAIDLGLDHVNTSVPDSIKALGVRQQVLENKVKAELTQLLVRGPNNASPAVLTPMLARPQP